MMSPTTTMTKIMTRRIINPRSDVCQSFKIKRLPKRTAFIIVMNGTLEIESQT